MESVLPDGDVQAAQARRLPGFTSGAIVLDVDARIRVGAASMDESGGDRRLLLDEVTKTSRDFIFAFRALAGRSRFPERAVLRFHGSAKDLGCQLLLKYWSRCDTGDTATLHVDIHWVVAPAGELRHILQE